MDSKQIQCFLAIAECRNFTGAATRLFISQPAVSRHIANLEEEIGITLFKRDKHSVELTPAGEVLKEGLSRLAEDYRMLIEKSQRVQRDNINMLRIGIPYYVSFSALPDSVCRFLEGADPHTVNVESFEYSELKVNLRSGRCDAIITIKKTLKDLDNVEYVPIVSCPIYILCSKTLIEGKERLGIKALDNCDCFIPDPKTFTGASEDVEKICRHYGISFRSVNVVPNTSTMILMCTTGRGVIMLHKDSWISRGISTDAHALFPTMLEHELVLVYPKDRKTPMVSELIKIIEETN